MANSNSFNKISETTKQGTKKSTSICMSSGGDTGGMLTKGRSNFTFVTGCTCCNYSIGWDS